MAKRINFNNEPNDNIEEKSPGIFQKLFFWFIIPLLFVIAILLVIAQFTNTNVFEMAKSLTNSDVSEEQSSDNPINSGQKIVELEAEIQEKEAQIEQLKEQIDSAKLETRDAIAIQEQLRQQIEELKRSQVEAKAEVDEIISTYELMSAKNAAPIITELSDEQAIKILSSLEPEKVSDIFSKMSPADAARYTELLSN